jgi:hypothetical protein
LATAHVRVIGCCCGKNGMHAASVLLYIANATAHENAGCDLGLQSCRIRTVRCRCVPCRKIGTLLCDQL